MKKFFTLIFTALLGITAMAQTAADLDGYYTSAFSYEDFGETYNQSSVVRVKAVDDTHVSVSGLFNLSGALIGEYNAESSTITFDNVAFGGSYAVADYNTQDPVVTMTVGDGTISLTGWGVVWGMNVSDGWFYKNVSCTMKKLNPIASVPATYILGDGANVKGETKVYFYSIDECDYDFGFELAEDLVLVYNDGDNIELSTDVIMDINPAAEFSKLEISAIALSGNNEKGTFTLTGKYYTESGWFADPVEEATFTLTWDGSDAISSVKAEQMSKALYNIAGQRVNKDSKGIVIQNGKKTVIK